VERSGADQADPRYRCRRDHGSDDRHAGRGRRAGAGHAVPARRRSGSRFGAGGRLRQNFVDYVAEGHRSLLTIAQIETPTGVEHAAEIAATDGIDALFVGPADLSASLGVFAEWNAPELDEAMADVIDAGAAADAPVGTLTVRESDVADRVERGFDYQITGKDMTTLIETGERIRETYEGSVSSRE